jgi:hypothetical protein
MTQDLDEFDIQPVQRPTFLTVLCILTFIGSSYAIISGTVTYFNADRVAKTLVTAKSEINEDINRKHKNDPEGNGFAAKVMDNMSVMTNPDNLRKSSLGSIIASLFCLAGAILMWRLNRKGFFIYVLGTIIGIAVPFYVFGNNFLTALSVGFAGFIGILFVIFYAMNLKSMK